jgi:hypothetical protein
MHLIAIRNLRSDAAKYAEYDKDYWKNDDYF